MYVVLLVCFGDLGVVLCCNGFVPFFLFWVFLIAMNMHLYVGLYVFSRLVLSSVLYGKQKGWDLRACLNPICSLKLVGLNLI